MSTLSPGNFHGTPLPPRRRPNHLPRHSKPFTNSRSLSVQGDSYTAPCRPSAPAATPAQQQGSLPSCCVPVWNASSTSSLPDLPPSSSVASPRKESLHRTSLSLCFLIYQGDTHHARFVEFSKRSECFENDGRRGISSLHSLSDPPAHSRACNVAT